MIKSVHVVPSIYEEASGTFYAVPKLCDSLTGQDVEVELHVLAPVPEFLFQTFEIHAHPSWPFVRRLGISPRMHRALATAAKTAQIMHNHGLWMLPNIYPTSVVKGTRCRLITSIHGNLSPYMLRRSRGLKKAVWALGQGSVLRNSACLHATAEIEYHDIRRKGLCQPVAVIPIGIEIPSEHKPFKNPREPRRLLFLSRIHPKKGIDILLRAWARIERQCPSWELYIVGPHDDEYFLKMQALAKELRIERVTFPGPVYGCEKSQAYWCADLFVLPTHSENFGLVIGEALAHGVPAIVTKGAPWSGLEKEKCGWWVDIGFEPLIECLQEAMSKSREELIDMGTRGRQWMKRDFSWERFGNMMYGTYEWVLGGGSPPEWVIID